MEGRRKARNVPFLEKTCSSLFHVKVFEGLNLPSGYIIPGGVAKKKGSPVSPHAEHTQQFQSPPAWGIYSTGSNSQEWEATGFKKAFRVDAGVFNVGQGLIIIERRRNSRLRLAVLFNKEYSQNYSYVFFFVVLFIIIMKTVAHALLFRKGTHGKQIRISRSTGSTYFNHIATLYTRSGYNAHKSSHQPMFFQKLKSTKIQIPLTFLFCGTWVDESRFNWNHHQRPDYSPFDQDEKHQIYIAEAGWMMIPRNWIQAKSRLKQVRYFRWSLKQESFQRCELLQPLGPAWLPAATAWSSDSWSFTFSRT